MGLKTVLVGFLRSVLKVLSIVWMGISILTICNKFFTFYHQSRDNYYSNIDVWRKCNAGMINQDLPYCSEAKKVISVYPFSYALEKTINNTFICVTNPCSYYLMSLTDIPSLLLISVFFIIWFFIFSIKQQRSSRQIQQVIPEHMNPLYYEEYKKES